MKKTILSLVLVLILALQAVPALASDIVFAPIGQTETKTASAIDVNSVVDKLNSLGLGDDTLVAPADPAANDLSTGLDLFAGSTTDKNYIVPFLNLTWKDLKTYGEDCKTMYQTECVSSSGYSYTINVSKAEEGVVSGTIKVKNDDRSVLVGVWNDLGADLLEEFGAPEVIEGVSEESQMCYQFVNDETYVRYEFMDYGDWRYILFVFLPM